MPLTILSDEAVQKVLHSLTREDINSMQVSLADALHFYSTSVESDKNACGAAYQTSRASIKRCDGSETLFMPAQSQAGVGVKMMTLSTPKELATPPGVRSFASLSVSSGSSSPSTTSSTTSGASSLTAIDLSDFSNTPSSWDDRTTTDNGTSPIGSLTLLDRTGKPRALINAQELTAFRTALASTMMFKKRANVHDVVVFGAGRQAYWHTRLALLLRGDEIHHLTIINRNFDTAKAMVRRLFCDQVNPGKVPLPKTKVAILAPQHEEYERLLKSTLRSSSVVFTTTPSTEPLFPHSIFTNTEGRKKGRYICAVGSYKPHMIELPPELCHQAVSRSSSGHHHHHHKHADQGGAVLVDSVDACLREAGEIVQAGLSGKEIVELGELFMLKRDAEKRRADHAAAAEAERRDSADSGGVELAPTSQASRREKSGGNSHHHLPWKRGAEKKTQEEQNVIADKSLYDWLTKGNVIYKSVGIGLMDVVVGNELVEFADQKGVGVMVEGF